MRVSEEIKIKLWYGSWFTVFLAQAIFTFYVKQYIFTVPMFVMSIIVWLDYNKAIKQCKNVDKSKKINSDVIEGLIKNLDLLYFFTKSEPHKVYKIHKHLSNVYYFKELNNNSEPKNILTSDKALKIFLNNITNDTEWIVAIDYEYTK